ncbi:EamA family transporter [Metabacillus sp. JX24]|uniref:EamA family transporter n=1 Tax=Metabacillus sp. JX24 TaxID=3240759 RepID=UPI00350FC993
MKEKLAPLWVLLAGVLWGTTGTAQTYAPDAAHPIAVGAARLAVGGFSLLLVALLIGQLNIRNWPIRVTVAAALCMAAYQPLFFTAVEQTGVAVGTVIAIGSAPLLSGALEWLLLRKTPSKGWWISTLLSIIGCFLLFFNKGAANADPSGILMALGAGLSFAVYTMVSKGLVHTASSLSVVAVVFTLSAVFLSPVLFFYDMSWMTEPGGLAVSLHLGLLATGAAYLLFAKALVHVPSSTAVTLALAEPLTAAILGVVLVREQLDLLSWTGVSCLILGIGFLAIFSRRDRAEKVVKQSAGFKKTL